MKRYLAAVLACLTTLFGSAAIAATSPAAADAASRNNSFAGDLYARLNQFRGDKNLFFSPYSISAALAMTAQGARGKTADQMNQVLHIGSDYQSGMAEITQALNPKDATFELSVANALWVDQTFRLSGDFVDQCKKNYNAGVVNVDFMHNAEPARQQINAAVASQTHAKIKDLIPSRGVDSSTALVLTNAIYFKGAWQTPFHKEATTDQPFHAASGKDITVPLMRSSSSYPYGETDDAKVISLPYKGAPIEQNANRPAGAPPMYGPPTISMLIILPKKADGLAALEKEATAANITQWSGSLRSQRVNLYLPRFTMTTQFELSKQLQAMGMTDAFTHNADFSGICASAGNKLAISAVIHKAFIDVNEEGTEAAAATAVAMAGAARPAAPPVEFRADHPFIFLIRHELTGSVLFMGQVNNPTE